MKPITAGAGSAAGRRGYVALALVGLALLSSLLTPAPPARAQGADQAGSVSLSMEEPEMGVPISATLTDADGDISGETWQWSSSDTATGTFTDISSATSATYRPAEADLEKYLKATVSYTDGHGSGKTASETTDTAVQIVSARIFVDHLFRRSGLVMVDISVVGEPGLATQFRTGGHPAGYEISEIRIALPLDLPFGGSLSESDFRAHIYSADADGNPDRSYFPMRPSFFQSGIHIFAPTVKRRLAPDTVYFFAMVSAGPLTSCNTADNDRYTSRASDWSTGVAFPLNAQGQWNAGMGMLERGCELKIEGEAAIDTAYVTGIDITSTPATARSYDTGDTLEATVTMSEAVTVDTASPPTLAVGISNGFLPTEDHRTMTYNATRSTSTALVFEYTVLAADDDQNGVAFNANVLMGTITRSSDSKAADKRHPFTNSDPDARVNAHPDVTVEFAEVTYMVAEGGSIDVTVEVSEDPKRTLVIPITAARLSWAAPSSRTTPSGAPT